MTDSPDRRDEQPPQSSSYPFAVPEERPEGPGGEHPGDAPDRRALEPGSPEWFAAQRARDEDEPRTDGFLPEAAPVTAVPGPEIFGGPPPPTRPQYEPLLPPVPPVKQPMGAPTPVPPRIGRPTMPYGYTGQIAPGSAGGGYQLMLPQIKPIHSGPAIGGVLAGSAGILAAIAVGCVGIMFDTVFGVAFTVLAVFLCGASLALAVVGLRQVKASGGEYTGKGTAISGMVLGGAGLFLTVVMILAVAAFSDAPGQSNDPPIGPSPSVSGSPRGR